MNKLPLTIIILTNRSDARFMAALKSAQVANEVLIIDNGTQADWATIRAQYSCIVLERHSEVTDFAQARTDALRHATNEWVFFLDSDEVLTARSIPQLAHIITENSYDGAVVYRSDIFHGHTLEYGEAGNQPIVRIAKKSKLIISGQVHEVLQVNGKIYSSSIQLLHYSHKSISDFIQKITVYAQLAAEKRKLTLPQLLIELIIFPPAKFIYNFILQGGSQDGWHGLVYASCMSLHSLLVRIYTYEKSFTPPRQSL